MIFTEASWNFTIDNYDAVWRVVVQIGLLLVSLLIGNGIRKINFLKKAFIPSALLGGMALLFLNATVNQIVKVCGGTFTLVDQSVMQVVTYHALGIGFIAISLKTNPKKEKLNLRHVVQNGCVTGGTYMLQAILGLAISLIFFAVKSSYFYDFGMLLPLGFGQGPGNALTWDINFSALEGGSLFNGNGSVGLTIASVGFIVASIGGVIYINIYKGRGEIAPRVEKYVRKVEDFESDNEILDSDSVDKMTIQVALVGLVYAISFGLMAALSFSNFTKQIAWGFNFIWGVIVAIVTRTVINALYKKQVIVKRKMVNNYQMDRISGLAFDLMIVAGVAAIKLEDVRAYIWPIIIMCVLGTVATYFYVRKMCKRCFKGFEHEAFLCNFGTLTGTASNGMILLREIDPNYETPTSSLYVASQLPAMIMVAPILLLIAYSATSLTACLICLTIFIVLFGLYTAFMLISAKKAKD